MKKIYLTPETEIVEVAFEAIMDIGSLGGEADGTMEGMSRESDWED